MECPQCFFKAGPPDSSTHTFMHLYGFHLALSTVASILAALRQSKSWAQSNSCTCCYLTAHTFSWSILQNKAWCVIFFSFHICINFFFLLLAEKSCWITGKAQSTIIQGSHLNRCINNPTLFDWSFTRKFIITQHWTNCMYF